MPTLLYLRGNPGSGKISAARILERDLNWKLFWLHDLDPVCRIVGTHKLPRLMDELSLPILSMLMATRRNLIYVRPSRDHQTVEQVQRLANREHYHFVLVTLTASYDTLLARVTARPDSECRINTKDGLDEYLSERPEMGYRGHIVETDDKTPEQVAAAIRRYLCE